MSAGPLPGGHAQALCVLVVSLGRDAVAHESRLDGHPGLERDSLDGVLDRRGGDASAAPTAETELCSAAWAGKGRNPHATLAALYAIESAQPQISSVKQQGLVELYGYEEGPATDYFDIHATLDHEHAEAHRAFLESAVESGEVDEDELIASAREVLRANWTLLDGVDRANGRAA